MLLFKNRLLPEHSLLVSVLILFSLHTFLIPDSNLGRTKNNSRPVYANYRLSNLVSTETVFQNQDETTIDSLLLNVFPLKKTYAFEKELEFSSVVDKQIIRRELLVEFCDSPMYKELNYSYAKDKNLYDKITMIRQFEAFECRIAKTGNEMKRNYCCESTLASLISLPNPYICKTKT